MVAQERADDPWVHPKACERRHEDINKQFADLTQLIRDLNDRLYHDNGHMSIQSILNYHGSVICVALWVLGIVGTTVLGGVCLGIWMIIRHVAGLE